MPVCDIRRLMEDAATNNRAVGAFSVGNMEMVLGAVKASLELKTPIILQIAEVRLKTSPLEYMAALMLAAAKKSSRMSILPQEALLNGPRGISQVR